MRFVKGAWLWASDHLTITGEYFLMVIREGVSGYWLAQHRDWQRRMTAERAKGHG